MKLYHNEVSFFNMKAKSPREARGAPHGGARSVKDLRLSELKAFLLRPVNAPCANAL